MDQAKINEICDQLDKLRDELDTYAEAGCELVDDFYAAKTDNEKRLIQWQAKVCQNVERDLMDRIEILESELYTDDDEMAS